VAKPSGADTPAEPVEAAEGAPPAETGKPEEAGKAAETGALRDLAEKTLLAGLGLLDAAKDQAQDALGSRAGPPLKERAQTTLAGLATDLGFVTRERYEELALTVAQLEHRVRLLEGPEAPPAETPAKTATPAKAATPKK
jgi:hypothetical protein